MVTHRKIGLFVSLLGVTFILITILLLFLQHTSDITLLSGTSIFTGITLIWLGFPISRIVKSETESLRNYRIVGSAGLILVFYVSPLLFWGFDIKDVVAGSMVGVGVVLWLVGYAAVRIQKDKPRLIYLPKIDRPIGISYANEHDLKKMVSEYLLGGDVVKEMFEIPLVTVNCGIDTYIGELIFTSKGICFINTGYFRNTQFDTSLLYLPNFFASVVIGAVITRIFHLSLKLYSLPVVAIVFMSLHQIENSFLQKRFLRKKNKVFVEKEDRLKNCKDFSDKVFAARDVYIFKKEEISRISGNRKELTIEDNFKTSVFQIESGAYEDYEPQIESYHKSPKSLNFEHLSQKAIKLNPPGHKESAGDVSLEFTNCPHCLVKGVLAMSDGRCPNCKKML